MTDSNGIKELENKLLSFITEEDPMLCMLQWITEKFMEIEVANKVGAPDFCSQKLKKLS